MKTDTQVEEIDSQTDTRLGYIGLDRAYEHSTALEILSSFQQDKPASELIPGLLKAVWLLIEEADTEDERDELRDEVAALWADGFPTEEDDDASDNE